LGGVTSDNHRDAFSDFADVGSFMGWMTYVAHHRGRVPVLPPPVRIEPVENKGTLIVLTQERFTITNPDHVELARHVRELLDHAGLLEPLQRHS